MPDASPTRVHRCAEHIRTDGGCPVRRTASSTNEFGHFLLEYVAQFFASRARRKFIPSEDDRLPEFQHSIQLMNCSMAHAQKRTKKGRQGGCFPLQTVISKNMRTCNIFEHILSSSRYQQNFSSQINTKKQSRFTANVQFEKDKIARLHSNSWKATTFSFACIQL